MAGTSIFVLGVALLTWGGVFLYLLRLAALARHLEAQLKAHQAQQQEARTEAKIASDTPSETAAETAPLSLP